MYQATKQLTKFAISGVTAVLVDFVVYFILSQFIDVNLSKGISFLSGSFVTYNMNKYWTWRQTDKDNKRLLTFMLLYLVAMAVNVYTNAYMLNIIPQNELILSLKNPEAIVSTLIAIKVNKILAFLAALIVSATLTFLGQKYWLFKPKTEIQS